MEAAGNMAVLEDGPRERLWRLGATALSDSELLAVLLGSSSRGHPVERLASSLVSASGGLRALAQCDPHELGSLPGLGRSRAAQLLAALELGRRAQRTQETRPRLRSPHEIYSYLRPTLTGLRREEFHVLCLNGRNVLLRAARIAEGTTNLCPVDPREVFGVALSCRASAIVVAHNHPSGDPEPSQEDLQLTRQLCAGGDLLGVRLLDHLVISDEGYTSLLERHQLPKNAGRELLRPSAHGRRL